MATQEEEGVVRAWAGGKEACLEVDSSYVVLRTPRGCAVQDQNVSKS